MISISLTYYLFMLPAAFFAPVIHECVKAYCSARLGDPSPKNKGFLSGNPLRYFEPVGFFCVLIFGYGWGQPVPTSPLYYKDRRRGVLITHIVPSVINLLVGLITAAAVRIITVVFPSVFGALPQDGGLTVSFLNNIGGAFGYLGQFEGVTFGAAAAFAGVAVLHTFSAVNIGLALFNIIPVYPLDGAKVLQLFLKPNLSVQMTHYEKIFQVILLLLLGMGLIRSVLQPVTDLILRLVWL
ncbi:MAG: site-2 protease family protein [Clostridiales bacterium]|jgi:Zn-dependent protease|nr:site-2 protease family protein [Clostridiales bacterium]